MTIFKLQHPSLLSTRHLLMKDTVHVKLLNVFFSKLNLVIALYKLFYFPLEINVKM